MVLSKKTGASGKNIIQPRKKIGMVRSNGKGASEVLPEEHLLAYSAVLFSASVGSQAGPGR